MGTSGSRGSTGKAGGVTGEKTAEGLDSKHGAKAFQDEGSHCLSNGMSRGLELLVSRESCWSKESSGKGGEPVMEKGRKAFQKMLNEYMVETGEVPAHRCREEGK